MKKLLLSLILILLILAFAVKPSRDPGHVSLGNTFASLSFEHPLGTDYLGRDVWALMVYGFKRTCLVVFIGSASALSVGVLLGLIAGYKEGIPEDTIQIVTDLSLIVPSFIVALIASALWGLTPLTAGLTLGLFDIGSYTKQVKELTRKIKHGTFIEAEHVLGISEIRILMFHILPHVIAPVKAVFANKASGLIIQFASLSFIGLGTDLTKPDWGTLLFEYRIYLTSHPLLILWPSVGIFLFALSFHIVFDDREEKLRNDLYV